MNNITFAIFTFNEEGRVASVIRNFINYGNVCIFDDGSTDNTKMICEDLGAKYFLRPRIGEAIVENENIYDFVKKNCETDWIFWGSADNIIPKTLLEKMKEISVMQEKYKYVLLPWHTYLWGRVSEPIYQGYEGRFFRKDYMDFANNKIHGVGRFLGTSEEILRLPNRKEYAVCHFSEYDVKKFVLGHLNYADIEASQRYESGERPAFWKTFGSMIRYFSMYFRDGWRAGLLGFDIAMMYAFFRLFVFFRLYELDRRVSLKSIREEYNKEKEKIIQEIYND